MKSQGNEERAMRGCARRARAGGSWSRAAAVAGLWAGVSALGLGVLGGCSTAKSPRFESHTARVTSSTDAGVAFEFVLDAFNDNEFGLPLRRLDYTLDVDGRTVFRGTRSAEVTIPGSGRQEVRVAASAPLEEAGMDVSGVRRYVLSGSVTYVTPGAFAELMFDTGVRVPSAGFRVEGEVEVPRVGGAGGAGGAKDAASATARGA